MLWPDSTSRTASCLYSSVYRARFVFIFFISLNGCSITQLRDTFFAGKLIVSHSRRPSDSTVQASLPSHEKESGEDGCGAEAGRAIVLDAAHQQSIRRSLASRVARQVAWSAEARHVGPPGIHRRKR